MAYNGNEVAKPVQEIKPQRDQKFLSQKHVFGVVEGKKIITDGTNDLTISQSQQELHLARA